LSTVRRIAQNTGFILLGQAVGAALGILLIVFLARFLGDVQYGKYAFAFAFTSLFLIISDLGLSTLSIREIARAPHKAGEYLITISLTKLVLSLIMVALIAIVINLMHYPRDTTIAVYIVASITVFTSFSTFFRAIFRAFEKMEYEAMTVVIERVLVVGAAIALLYLGYGLIEVVFAMLVAQAIACVFTLMICVRKFARPQLRFDFSLSKRLVKAALPFGIASLFAAIIFQTDTVMLSIMKGDAVVGWYNAAYRLVLGIIFIPSAFVSSVYPVLSRYFVSSKDSLAMGYEKSFKFLGTMAIPLGIGSTLIAGKLIFLLYGTEFANSAITLQILIWAASLIFVRLVVGHTLASIDRQIVDMRIAGACALLNVVLNLILIPRFSYVGAGIASVISQIVIFTLEFNYLQKHLHRIKTLIMFWKPLCAAVVMGGVIYVLNNLLTTTWVNLFTIIFCAIIIYVVLLYLFKAFDHQEIQLIKSAFKVRTYRG
jgi:O-antigen/teichoic acid export membrane protein